MLVTTTPAAKVGRMKSYFFYIFEVFFGSVAAQHLPADTVVIGAFVSSLNNLDIGSNTVGADIHLWCLYGDSSYDFAEQIEFINSDEINYSGTSVEKMDAHHWFYTKALVTTRQKFTMESYPFDSQKLVFQIESSEYTTDDFVFMPDKGGSKLDTLVHSQFEEWFIESISFDSTHTAYQTSFGDISALSSCSPRFDITMVIRRKGSFLILFKLITGIIVAFLISSCVFWIRPTNTDPRFGLCVGGLFAAIGNKYIVESIITETNELTLLDYLHNITFIAIFLVIIISVVSLRLYESSEARLKALSARIDRVSFCVVTTSYVAAFYFFIHHFSS